ncbi:hypothetical protein JAAARDRAFT_38588 [Jaapia argillacea MUCL 33604]|uniref:DUF6699 domain-containing protein n=1 Tax=Jaapia argillacea MUCL 33604 TaxID=933084 RepID=A0A067PT11_9AGAM|nr:hypothetical protein JAAARDRAFT_38588 [Jaapia argillacea MUCL 33604]
MLTSIPPLLLLSSATNPPLPSMTIVSSQIPWQIMVTPSSTSYITLSDVMSAIYTSLRTSISRAEFESLPVKAKIQVNDAFVQRWKSVAGGQREMGTERSKGVKRVDWFCGRTRFEALELAESGGGEFWVLRVRGGSQDLGDPMKHRSAPEPVEPMSLPDIYSPSHVPHTPSSRSFTRTPAAWQIHPERYAPSGSRSANQLGNTHHLQTSQ